MWLSVLSMMASQFTVLERVSTLHSFFIAQYYFFVSIDHIVYLFTCDGDLGYFYFCLLWLICERLCVGFCVDMVSAPLGKALRVELLGHVVRGRAVLFFKSLGAVRVR